MIAARRWWPICASIALGSLLVEHPLRSADRNGNGVEDGTEIALGTAEDCNANGVPDSCDIAAGVLPDEDGDGIADSCDSSICRVPGDCNEDRVLDLSDAICILRYLFLGQPSELPCGDRTRTDAISLPWRFPWEMSPSLSSWQTSTRTVTSIS